MILELFYSIIISPIELFIEAAYAFFGIVVRYNPIFPIFGISVVVTICCLPLYAKAEYIQRKERALQKRMKEKITSIKKHFTGDERYMILSMYYRENHYHPVMALRSTLNLLIQVPFFIAAYHFLSHIESLKGAGFLFINDLGSPDSLLSIRIPFIGGGGQSINLLPVIMTAINIISGSIYTKEYELREKFQLFGMALVFLVLLYNSPAGLVLYWTFNNVFSLIKNIVSKSKKPLKLFYILVLAFLFCSCIFVFFFRSQGKSGSFLFKAITLGTALFISAIPLYVKLLDFAGKKYFYTLKSCGHSIKQVFLLAILSIWILCSIVIPLNVISSDASAFSFLGSSPNPLSLVFPAACISLGIFVFWPCCIFFIFSKKIKAVLSFLSCFFLVSAAANVFIFFGSNGTLSETLTFVSDTALDYSRLFTALNFIFLITAAFGLTILYRMNKIKTLSSLIVVFLAGGISISIWKGFVIQKEYLVYNTIRNENRPQETGTENNPDTAEKLQPAITLSKTGKNVIVIMLDRAVGSYLPLIFEEKPELNSAYSGFVYYPNVISFFRSTILGAPPIFGGYEYTPEELHKRKDISMADKNDEALLLMPLLFMKNGFDVSVFDLPYVNYQSAMTASFFLQKGIYADALMNKFYNRYLNEFPEKIPVNPVNYDKTLRRNFVFFGITAAAPPILRKPIYQKGKYWAVQSTDDASIVSAGAASNYAALYYLPELSSCTGEKNTLTLLVNNLTHSPSFLQYPDYAVVSQVTDIGPERLNNNSNSQRHYHVNAAAYLLLARWFDALKENGVYDNTRIIIVSDHDELLVKPLFSAEMNRINTFYNPILMVKDFAAGGNLQTNTAFMTTADVPFLALQNLIPDPHNPFTGKAIERREKDEGVYIYLGGSAYTRDYPGWEALEKNASFYHVKDNIFDEKNWTKVTKQVY